MLIKNLSNGFYSLLFFRKKEAKNSVYQTKILVLAITQNLNSKNSLRSNTLELNDFFMSQNIKITLIHR